MSPNPNAWCAHLFLHWVDVDGPFKEWTFEKKPMPQPAGFAFPKR